MATPTLTQLELSRYRLGKGTSPNPRFRQRQPKSGVSCTLQSTTNARARAQGAHGPQQEGQWDEVQSRQGLTSGVKEPERTRGPRFRDFAPKMRSSHRLQRLITAIHGFGIAGRGGLALHHPPRPRRYHPCLSPPASVSEGSTGRDPRTLQSPDNTAHGVQARTVCSTV